jgi:hypothetical protein
VRGDIDGTWQSNLYDLIEVPPNKLRPGSKLPVRLPNGNYLGVVSDLWLSASSRTKVGDDETVTVHGIPCQGDYAGVHYDAGVPNPG